MSTYDATTGVFLSRDPIGEAGGINLYSYGAGNPVSNVDPSGHVPFALPLVCAAGGCEAAAAGAAALFVGTAAAVGAGLSWCTDRVRDKSKEERCEEEERDAEEQCKKQLSRPPHMRNRRFTGPNETMEECKKGWMSEDCGGNPTGNPRPDLPLRLTVGGVDDGD